MSIYRAKCSQYIEKEVTALSDEAMLKLWQENRFLGKEVSSR